MTKIANTHLSAVIAAKGAELQSVIPSWGGEMIWQGDPAWWPWHAPNLFPVVGALAGDMLVHQGHRYPLKSHGFLRHSLTETIAAEPERALFRLTDSPETRAQYPFAFILDIEFRLEDDRLIQSFILTNPAETPLIAGLGGHPAFNWPLAPGLARFDHVVVFDREETGPIRRIAERALDPEPKPSPVSGKVLRLSDDLFDADAIIWEHMGSRRLTFGVPGGPGIEFDYPDFPHFGIWTKPGGAPFLCLEPWQGYISPQGFTGEFADKPGVAAVAPGQWRCWSFSIRPVPEMAEAPAPLLI